jgi:hypothetical protein
LSEKLSTFDGEKVVVIFAVRLRNNDTSQENQKR